MAIVGAISLVMVALVMGGPKVFENVLPEDAVAWLNDFGMGGTMSGDSAARSDNPQDHLRDTSDGWKPSAKIAAMPGNRAVFVKEVISGRSTSIEGDSPAAVVALNPVQDCRITPPSEGAFVGHVSAGSATGVTLGVSTYGDAELAAAVQQFAKYYRATGLRRVEGQRTSAFDAFDVAVTETARPVYLVLQTTDQLRLWNIHLAPGARIERVVLLGGREAGVANLPAGVPVEVLRSAEISACGLPRPFYPLNPGALLFQSMEAGTLKPEDGQATLDRIAAAGQAYDAWFRATFGVGADETMAGNWGGGTIAVAGPKPASDDGRAVWQPITGSTAQITLGQYLEYAALADEGADFAARVIAIATAYAWGDLENLTVGEDL